MEKLMKPAEYAKELGISRQAVYAKIKRGILTSKNVEGKLYIVVDNVSKKETTTTAQSKTTTPQQVETSTTAKKDYKALLQAKDETIAVLKETVVDLKESNKQISTTLRGEIDLLKDAFHEMRTLYVRQLEHKSSIEEDAIEIHTDEVQEVEARWIGLKKFFKQADIRKEKAQEKASKRLNKAYKKGDERLKKVDGKLKLNAEKSYEDILN
ncbi:MAG TPA: DUF3972 domain-containing protein [Epsilonproteobacteria bacterium]|nr:DUF3972 domain-containing protein [Campylobacterota bacterium]